jgi:hypothetical protein
MGLFMAGLLWSIPKTGCFGPKGDVCHQITSLYIAIDHNGPIRLPQLFLFCQFLS